MILGTFPKNILDLNTVFEKDNLPQFVSHHTSRRLFRAPSTYHKGVTPGGTRCRCRQGITGGMFILPLISKHKYH